MPDRACFAFSLVSRFVVLLLVLIQICYCCRCCCFLFLAEVYETKSLVNTRSKGFLKQLIFPFKDFKICCPVELMSFSTAYNFDEDRKQHTNSINQHLHLKPSDTYSSIDHQNLARYLNFLCD